MAIPSFKIREHYSSLDIQSSLQVGNAGGVRCCLDDNGGVRRMVVTTADSSIRQAGENPYHDRLEGQILVYTGAGRLGDQSLGGVNKRIPQQPDAAFPIYAFRQVEGRRNREFGPNRWQFFGLLEYLRHYPETQIDIRGAVRKVWIFEFAIHDEVGEIPVNSDREFFRELLASTDLSERISEDDRAVSEGRSDLSAQINFSEIENTRRSLLSLSPESFEHLIKRTLIQTGFCNVCVTKFSQDGGIDVIANPGPLMWPLTGLSIQLQAKRWRHTVGRKEVAELRGSLAAHARGTIVTTSHFQRPQLSKRKRLERIQSYSWMGTSLP